MATRIKELRDKLGLTLTDFAERLNVNYTTICKWENKGTIPRPQAIRICKEFGCEISWLLPDYTESEEDADDKTLIGQRLQEARAYLNWTVEEMAKQLDVSKGTISLWEKNGTVPSRRLRAVAEKLNVSFDWLKTGEGEMFSATQAVQRAGTPKDLAVIYGCDHRTAAFLERYVQLPDGERKQFNSTLAKLILDRQIQVDDSAKMIDDIQKEKPH